MLGKLDFPLSFPLSCFWDEQLAFFFFFSSQNTRMPIETNTAFRQWNTTFGTPAHTEPNPVSPASSLNIASSSGAPEIPSLDDIQAVNSSLPPGSQHSISPQQYAAAPVPNFVTPAMWQESVANVYEGGLKRSWDYDGVTPAMKRR